MDPGIEKAREELNERLKSGGHRCRVQRLRNSLFLRATLPVRNDPGQRRKQRIALGLTLDYSSPPEAESKAIKLSHQLGPAPSPRAPGSRSKAASCSALMRSSPLPASASARL